MKGGGLTWAGWLMVGVGGMLIYSGMTGNSLVAELSNVLHGRKLDGPKAGGGTLGPPAPAGPSGSANAAEQHARERAVPTPSFAYGETMPGHGAGGGQ